MGEEEWDGKVDALIMLELPQSGPVRRRGMKGQRDGLEAIVGKVDESKVSISTARTPWRSASAGERCAQHAAGRAPHRDRLHQR
jgi:hypothetical protein